MGWFSMIMIIMFFTIPDIIWSQECEEKGGRMIAYACVQNSAIIDVQSKDPPQAQEE